jgi:hypothetical protein
MTVQTHRRLDLAENQLETAVGLFIGGHNRFSVIALAAAADGIFVQLVANKGEENFIEFSLRKESGKKLTRGKLGKQVNDILHINALKHMDKDDDGYVVMDVEQCAIAAILKAIANFVRLRGREVDFVIAFLAWVKLNLDPKVYNVDCDPDWEPSNEPASAS